MDKERIIEQKLLPEQVCLYYLGQVGMLMQYRGKFILIDGYLSDYVDVAREKYEQLIEKGSTPDEAFAKIWADREECTAEQLKEMLEIA